MLSPKNINKNVNVSLAPPPTQVKAERDNINIKKFKMTCVGKIYCKLEVHLIIYKKYNNQKTVLNNYS
jgi:hypothetical protein